MILRADVYAGHGRQINYFSSKRKFGQGRFHAFEWGVLVGFAAPLLVGIKLENVCHPPPSPRFAAPRALQAAACRP
jgi:hypothetical protein